jgi:NIMA-interacting peptidyl-prolyl cis-trans isomerase 1
MSESGLPEGWQVRHSKSRNLPYYFNAKTSESRWEPPSGTNTELLASYMASHHSGGNAAAASGSSGNADKIRVSHLLIKHKDSRRPSSWKTVRLHQARFSLLTSGQYYAY